jgi:hypothetical protein
MPRDRYVSTELCAGKGPSATLGMTRYGGVEHVCPLSPTAGEAHVHRG